ncbi:hypothetical protein PENTCL1PPCAC_16911 [Pristionchus entomophagus]|uniref:Cytochrome P450 n=1 Tax=Pristionchus entomophagus TaxID=358040 RepID=A0AAV5TKB3_9BILA|nr:hypothetical protein PENTCL1PPCAC_16911 [Pristionchus entomophagus]
MLILLLALPAVALLLFLYYSQANRKWANRGLSGPEPELLLGNLREVWNFDKPRSIVLRDWSKKYGKIYGFYEGQRPFIVISDFYIINEILVKQQENFAARARFAMQERKVGPNTRITEARGPHWKRLRSLGSLAFTNKSLRNILHTVEESATTVVDGMERVQGEINMLEYFQEFTMDVICKIALGMRDVKMFNNEYLDSCREVFYRPMKHPITTFVSLFPFTVDEVRAGFMLLSKVVTNKSPFFVLMGMLKKNVEKRKLERQNCEDKSESTDFIDIFLDAEVDASEVKFGEDSDTARKLSADEIVGQCLIFLLAGFDTTSNSLSYLTHFLANHRDVQQKLVDEIDSFLTDNETFEIDRLSDLKYMEAVIKESLRHYPLANVALTRECTNACEIGGFRFEVGDSIQTDTWSLHKDKTIWGDDAEEFRPERWLEPSSRPRSAFQTFGEGPRICLGMRLAYVEEKVALLKLLSRFTIEKTQHTNPIKLVGSLTVSPERVMVNLVKR